MWRKVKWVVVAVVMALVVLAGGATIQDGHAASDTDTVNVDSHVHGLTAPSAIDEISGDTTIPVTDMTAPLEMGQQYRLHYAFKIDDDSTTFKLAAGDTATVTLPATSLYSGGTSGTIVQAGTTTVLGTIALANGATTGTVTFTKAFTNMTARSASFDIIVRGSGNGGSGTVSGRARAISKVGWIGDADFDDQGAPTKITWNISIDNENKSYGKTTVTDQLGQNQTYIPGSISMLDGAKEPQVTVEGQKITFVFADVQKTTAFTYQTTPGDLSGKDQETFTNQAELTATNGTTGMSGDNGTTVTNDPVSVDSSYLWTRLGGVGNGKYTISFTKTNDQHPATPLPGAQYQLKKFTDATYSGDGVIVGTQTTDAQGQLSFTHLTAGYYTLTEVQAPDDYAKNPQPVQVVVTDQNVTATQTDTLLTPVNQGRVTLTKVDADQPSRTLSGAVFKLQRADTPSDYQDVTGKTNLITDEKGQISVEGLAAGDYRFVELGAPDGYTVNHTPIDFTIKSGDTKVQNWTAKDQKLVTPPEESNSSSNSSSSNSSSSNNSSSSVSSSSSFSSSSSSTSSSETSTSSTSKTRTPSVSVTTSTSASSSSHSIVVQGGQNGTGTTPPRQATAEGHGGQGASQQGYSAISRLPQTSEQQRVSAFVLGILVLGGALSYQAWRRRE